MIVLDSPFLFDSISSDAESGFEMNRMFICGKIKLSSDFVGGMVMSKKTSIVLSIIGIVFSSISILLLLSGCDF